MSYPAELADAFIRSRRFPSGIQLTLGDQLENWVDLGDAVVLAGGDFSLYLAAVVHIVVSIEENDGLSAAFERPLLNFENGNPACLEPGFWGAAVFRRQHGIPHEDEARLARRRPQP